MSCSDAGKNKSTYTGNQVGWLNYVGFFNFVSGGPAGSGLAASSTIVQFVPKTTNRAVWKRKDATFDDKLLDAAYPTVDLQWFAEIALGDVTFRVSNRSFYVQDADGNSRYYDARCSQAPQISVDVGEWLQPSYQVSDLNIELNNRDGFFNDYLAMGSKFRQWTGAEVTVKIGFGEKYSNYMTIFSGKVADKQGLSTTRDSVILKVYDRLAIDNIPMPPRVFSSDNYPDVDPNYAGKSVPLIYGDWSEDVPTWGAVNAVCTNAEEADATSYSFKVSDLELKSLDSVWLHRGGRAADKPQGPIRIAESAITVDLDSGEFSIPAAGTVLDEPFYVLSNGKAGDGSGLALITSDTDFDFILNGVKIGDNVIDGTVSQASITQENIEFKPTATGSSGNGFQIDYVLLPVVYLKDAHGPSGNKVNNLDPFGQPLSLSKCYATKISPTQIQVAVVQYLNDPADVSTKLGKHTAGAIKSAVQFNTETNALVRCNLVGTVPFGYPVNSKLSDVDQTVPAGPLVTSSGQDPTIQNTITSVTNYQLGLSGSTTFSQGDSYKIISSQYSFDKSDKFSIVCRGKPLQKVSTTRLSDVTTDIKTPDGLCVGFDGTYWIADNTTQKIYNLSFANEILSSIDFSDLSATLITGLSITNDGFLWIADQASSTVYRYNTNDGTLGLTLPISSVTGIGATLTGITGIAIQPNNQFWISDKNERKFYLIDAFASTTPFVVTSFSSDVSDGGTNEITDICYDGQVPNLCYVDRGTNSFYRLDPTDGTLDSQLDLASVNPNLDNATGISVAQDDTLFILDAGNLAIYNYNELLDADNNPACIARDLLQGFRNHDYADFDLSWNQTSRQLASFRARMVYDDPSKKLVEQVNFLLGQFNVVFHIRMQKFALFWMTYDNFRANGRAVKEKDIIQDSFKPQQEFNQYFNAANANKDLSPFAGDTGLSDNYISPAAVSFAGAEYDRTLDLPYIYRRADLDTVMPLFVRLSSGNPEFVVSNFGFRVIRTQIHDFLTINFSDDGIDRSGRPTLSGRRFNAVPCMVRSLKYDLDAMTVEMKLWSLGNTSFPGYTASGSTIGGPTDAIVLSNLGRLGRVSPVATITAHGTATLTVDTVSGMNAESRVASGRLAWTPGYKVDLVNAATKSVVQTLTIASVSGSVITFDEDLSITPGNTTYNAAGFATGGHILSYSTYDNLTQMQRDLYASFGKPLTNYPTSHSQEIAEQRSGAHGFSDSGKPYILYPEDFTVI